MSLTKSAKTVPMAIRQEIAAVLDNNEAAWATVNSIPEVAEARKKANELRHLHDEASKKLSAVFDKHAQRGLDAKLARQHPGVLVLGTGEEDYMQWIPRCAVTRLPIFIGDEVYIGGKDEGMRTYILAHAVTLAPGVDAEPVTVGADGEAA